MSRELERSRRRFEESLADLAESIGRELGTVPRLGRWALVIAASAAGFVAGGVVASRVEEQHSVAVAGEHACLRHLSRTSRVRDDRCTVARGDVPGGELDPVARAERH